MRTTLNKLHNTCVSGTKWARLQQVVSSRQLQIPRRVMTEHHAKESDCVWFHESCHCRAAIGIKSTRQPFEVSHPSTIIRREFTRCQHWNKVQIIESDPIISQTFRAAQFGKNPSPLMYKVALLGVRYFITPILRNKNDCE